MWHEKYVGVVDNLSEIRVSTVIKGGKFLQHNKQLREGGACCKYLKPKCKRKTFNKNKRK
jgi:hypothetical protein